MADGNQLVLDQSVRYAVFLERYKSGVVNRLQDILLEADLDELDRLERLLGRLSQADLQRLASGQRPRTQAHKALTDYLAKLRDDANTRLNETLLDEVAPVALLKTERNRKIAASIRLELGTPSEGRVTRALKSSPFQGKVLGEWTKDWGDAKVDRVLTSLRLAFTQGQSIPEMVKTLRGTRARNYQDGLLNTSRRSAATLARTATNHMVSQADALFAQENSSVIKYVVWTAVLDSRTSDICKSNDGRRFKPDEDFAGFLPAHPGCRSVWTYVYKGEGRRQDKDYYDWLKDQPRDLVEEALGKKKAQLFLDGGLGKGELVRVATTGKPYTLDELRTREAEAFEAAGL